MKMRSAGSTEQWNDTRVTVGVTHEVEIKGDRSWIKFEASSTLGEGETKEELRDRVIGYVDESVMKTVEQAVNTVNGIVGK